MFNWIGTGVVVVSAGSQVVSYACWRIIDQRILTLMTATQFSDGADKQGAIFLYFVTTLMSVGI